MPSTNNRQIIKLNRNFAFIVAGALLFIAAFQYIFKHKQDIIIVAIAILLLLLAFVTPKLLTPLRSVWDKLGHLLGIINTYVLLTTFYFLVLMPLGLLMRLFGRDTLKLKREANNASYWDMAPEMEENKMENQF